MQPLDGKKIDGDCISTVIFFFFPFLKLSAAEQHDITLPGALVIQTEHREEKSQVDSSGGSQVVVMTFRSCFHV